jgi:hypothetical protein
LVTEDELSEPDDIPEPTQETVSSQPSPDRRKLFRRLAALAGLGITGVLLSQDKVGVLPRVGACSGSTCFADNVAEVLNVENTGSGIAVFAETLGAGDSVHGKSLSGYGVYGTSTNSDGVHGESSVGSGVYGNSTNNIGVYGSGSLYGMYGSSTNGIGGVFTSGSGIAIYANGKVGIGTSTPSYLLHIVGNTTTQGGLAENLRVESLTTSEVGIGLNNLNTGGHLWQIESTGGFATEGQGKLGFYDETAGAWRMILDGSGNVGIGTTSPENMLHVGGGATSDVFCGIGPHPNTIVGGVYTGPAMNFGYSGNSFGEGSGFFNVRPDPSAVAPNPSLRFMTVNVQRMIITNTGNVGIGTSSPDQALSVSGNADKSSGGTSWGTFCDRRWKDPASIRPFTLGLDWVRTLPSPVRFRYAVGNGIGADPLEENVNFIAQDLQDGVHNNLVYTTRSKVRMSDKEPTTMYGVNVNDMHFALVNAVKEQQKQISELTEQNRALAEQVAEQNQALREEIRLLKSRLDASLQTIKLAAS